MVPTAGRRSTAQQAVALLWMLQLLVVLTSQHPPKSLSSPAAAAIQPLDQQQRRSADALGMPSAALQAHRRSRRLQQAQNVISPASRSLWQPPSVRRPQPSPMPPTQRAGCIIQQTASQVPAVAAANRGTVREAAAARIELHGLFGSGMVLSRSGRIFGTAMPGAAISVRLLSSTTAVAGHRQAAAAAAAATSAVASGGAWSANRTMRGGGPYDLQVSATSTTLSDVYVGDVYLLSGQSNANVSLSYLANYCKGEPVPA